MTSKFDEAVRLICFSRTESENFNTDQNCEVSKQNFSHSRNVILTWQLAALKERKAKNTLSFH